MIGFVVKILESDVKAVISLSGELVDFFQAEPQFTWWQSQTLISAHVRSTQGLLTTDSVPQDKRQRFSENKWTQIALTRKWKNTYIVMGKMLNTHSTINALLTKIQLPKQKMRHLGPILGRHTYWCTDAPCSWHRQAKFRKRKMLVFAKEYWKKAKKGRDNIFSKAFLGKYRPCRLFCWSVVCHLWCTGCSYDRVSSCYIIMY